MEEDKILSALAAIDVASLSRADWIKVGMALKAEGYSCSVWDDWSKPDKRYHSGECQRLWDGFNGSGITGGTIIQMAKERGWIPDNDDDQAYIRYIESTTQKTFVDRYDYTDLNGKYHHTKIRLVDWKGDKKFCVGRMDGKKFLFSGKKNGKIDTHGTVFGSVSDVKKAIEKGDPVFLVEGEKDQLTMKKKGYPAITYGSAESWSSQIAPLFENGNVIVLADNDSDGENVAKHIKKDLSGIVKSIKVIFPCTKRKKGDITDFFDSGGTIEELEEMINGPGSDLPEEETDEDQQTDQGIECVEDVETDIEQSGPNFDCDTTGKIYQTDDNVVIALESDPELSGSIKYNELARSAYLCGTVPWDHNSKFREWRNIDDAYLYAHLEREYGLTNRLKIADGLSIVADKNSFNPVTDRLSHIYRKEWDHQAGYIENLLPDYMGVEKNVYSIECMKLIMLGAINRAFNPGCKFDYMPVLVGKQGIGKSTFFKYLAIDPNWYNDNFNTIEGDKAFEKIRGYWFVEMAELLATKRAKDVEAIKSFLTSTTDTYRQPYDRRAEHRERMCVFVGTTNDEQFLTDRTGNRRFLPLQAREDHITKSLFDDPAAVQQDFINAWGEAMDLYLHDPDANKLILSEEASVYAQEAQQAFTEDDPRIGLIQEWLDENEKVTLVCACMLYRKALENYDMSPSRRESNEILSIMANDIDGWKRVPGKKYCPGYGTTICYERIVTTVSDKNVVTPDQDDFMQVPDENNIPFS